MSNFWPASIVYEGIRYPSVEHAYQAAKTLDKEERHRIAKLPSAGAAKKAGSKIKPRPDWYSVNLQIMEDLIYCKFANDPIIRKFLLDTGDEELVEGNNWGDTFWGVCDGIGKNHLGKILMKVRERLRG